jgi:threonine/homoserine/homoserine lactone efflux protein
MLTGIDHLGLFIATGLLLNLTPGPDVLYIMTHSLKSGWRSGAVAALGITAGCFVHIAAAVLGLSAVLASSGSAFALLKWLGAAYLVYVGWGMLGLGRRATQSAAPMPQAHEVSATDLIAADAYSIGARGKNDLKKVFINGFWTNALNPKVALFFLAFLQQFIAPEAPDKTLAFLWLGLLFNFNGLWVNLGYAALGAFVSQRVTALQHGMGWLERLAGTLFIGFGVKLALADHSPH